MRRPAGRNAFAFIFATVLLDVIALGIVIPVFPRLVEDLQGGNTADASTIFGVFGALYAAMQFVFSPILGALSDRFGRRPVLLLSMTGLGLDYVLMALAPSIAWLFVGRIVSGITTANFATASAYITDVTPPEQRAARFGLLGAAFGSGFVIGPAIGGLLGSSDPRLPFWVAAGLTLANVAYGALVLPESLRPENRARFRIARASPIGSLRLLAGHPDLYGFAAAGFLARLAHDSLVSIYVLYAGYRYGWSARDVGIALAVVGVCSLIVQGGLVGPIVRRIGERRAVLLGTAIGACGFALYGVADTGRLFLLATPLVALWGIAGPSLQALMTQRVGPDRQGALQGAIQSLGGIAGVIAPLVFTQILTLSIERDRLLGGGFLVAALLLVAALAVVARTTRGEPLAVPEHA